MLNSQNNLKGRALIRKSLEKNPVVNYKVTPEDMWYDANSDTKSIGMEGYKVPRKFFYYHQTKK